MNHIHTQKGGICTVYSCANAYEKLSGIVLTDEQILKLFHDSGGGDWKEAGGAVTYPEVLETMKQKKMIKSYERIYMNAAPAMPKNPEKKAELDNGILRIKAAMGGGKPKRAIVVGFFVPTGGVKLDDRGFMIRGDRKGYHAVHLLNYINETFVYENSYGKDWGLDGLFKMTQDVFDSMVREAWLIK